MRTHLGPAGQLVEAVVHKGDAELHQRAGDLDAEAAEGHKAAVSRASTTRAQQGGWHFKLVGTHGQVLRPNTTTLQVKSEQNLRSREGTRVCLTVVGAPIASSHALVRQR